MANLKDLIVNGAARIIGKTYSSEFVGNVTGNLTGNADTATKAEGDSAGNPIAATYIKDLSVDDQTITYTKGDDTSGTIITKDTTYSEATATSAGLMSADDKSTLDNIAGSGTPFVRKRDNGYSYNNLASFYTAGKSYNYIRITVPQGGSTWTMCTLEISLKQDHSAGRFGKILFHGNWSSSSEWNALYSHVYGRLSEAIKLYTSDKKYIYIAGCGDWCTCSVDKMLIGDNATGYDLSAVTIDGVSSLPSTYQTVDMVYEVNYWKKGDLITGAVFNDLADAVPVGEGDTLEAGYCYGFDGEHYTKTSEYMQKSYIGIHSDTYGFKMGHEEGKEKLNVAVSGFVLAYVDREYEVGTPLTCTEDGRLTEIKLEDKIKYPERVIATYWKNEPNEEWGSEGKKVRVNGRKWVKVK